MPPLPEDETRMCMHQKKCMNDIGRRYDPFKVSAADQLLDKVSILDSKECIGPGKVFEPSETVAVHTANILVTAANKATQRAMEVYECKINRGTVETKTAAIALLGLPQIAYKRPVLTSHDVIGY